jgi:hypothetical protein
MDKVALEIAQLEKRIRDEAPAPGSNPLANDLAAPSGDAAGSATAVAVQMPAARKFVHLPLSQLTQDALAKSKFVRLTDIQRYASNMSIVLYITLKLMCRFGLFIVNIL